MGRREEGVDNGWAEFKISEERACKAANERLRNAIRVLTPAIGPLL